VAWRGVALGSQRTGDSLEIPLCVKHTRWDLRNIRATDWHSRLVRQDGVLFAFALENDEYADCAATHKHDARHSYLALVPADI
jgi:hypothetical protein